MAKKKKNKFSGQTHILFVLDESGSMGIVRDKTISGFNEYVTNLKADHTNDDVIFSLVKFNTEFKPVFVSKSLDVMPTLNHSSYSPSGLTALFDAVAYGVNTILSGTPDEDRALVIIITDGEENSSKEFNRDQIFNLIAEKEKTGNWTFTYLGANQDSWLAGGAINIAKGNIANYEAQNPQAAIGRAYTATNQFLNSHERQSRNFYDTD